MSGKKNLQWVEAFLDHFAVTCNIEASCRAAGTSRWSVKRHRGDAEFDRKYRAAEKRGIAAVEASLRNGTINGKSAIAAVGILRAHR